MKTFGILDEDDVIEEEDQYYDAYKFTWWDVDREMIGKRVKDIDEYGVFRRWI